MTTPQEDNMQPTHLIHWLDEDSLILEVHQENHCMETGKWTFPTTLT